MVLFGVINYLLLDVISLQASMHDSVINNLVLQREVARERASFLVQKLDFDIVNALSMYI